MKKTTEQMKTIFESAKELETLIMGASDDDIEELDDNVGDGFPIGIAVSFDEDGDMTIGVELGHNSYSEWHGMGDTVEMIRAEPHKLLMRLTDHIETAIENQRDVNAERWND